MIKIISSSQIASSCIEIFCGDDQGTGFAAAPKKIITAFHVVSDNLNGEKINAKINGSLIECIIVSYSFELDLCILSFSEQELPTLPLEASILRINENCETHGFPSKSNINITPFQGKISQMIANEISDYIISDLGIDSGYDYEGLSGAPLIIGGKVYGIILRQIDDRLAFISTLKAITFLAEAGIKVEENTPNYGTPIEFEDQISTSTPNLDVLKNIDQALLTESKWFLLQGSPGSGKSTLSASYIPLEKNLKIIGRYFLKIPNSTESGALRKSRGFFLDYLENLCSTIITGSRIPKEEISFEDRLLRLPDLLSELGLYYQNKAQTGILILDGLDEIEFLNDFLSILPLEIPAGVKILLSCTSIQILPSSIKSLLQEEQIIDVTPLGASQCENFIIKVLGTELLNMEAVQELALKSEGHPLYLRYLVNFIKNTNSNFITNELEQWLNEIPSIKGDITKYYESIWQRFYESPEKLWIMIIFSQVREPISETEAFGMLPETYKLTFRSHFESIKYLLYGDQYLEIYHNSFKLFIESRTSESSELANDYICGYLEKDSTSDLSINNLLYHYSRGSKKHLSLQRCNQDWADLCTKNDVPPDLVLSDIKQIISLSIDLQETLETIRLLLLLQRIDFRYDSVFAENAYYLALAMISVKNYSAALKYLVRDRILLVDDRESILFLRLFFENQAFHEAEILLSALEKRYRKTINDGLRWGSEINVEIFGIMMKAYTLLVNYDFEQCTAKCLSINKILLQLQNNAEDAGDNDAMLAFLTIREQSTAWHNSYILRTLDFYVNVEKRAEDSKLEIDSKWVNMLSRTANIFEDLNHYNTSNVRSDGTFKILIEDIEHVISSYGYESENLESIIYSLIYYSRNHKLVTEIIDKCPKQKQEYDLRLENRVDPNYDTVHDILFQFRCIGYLDKNCRYPVQLSPVERLRNWEDYLIGVLSKLGFLEGKILFLKAIEENYEFCIDELIKLCLEINFSLQERIIWERSYHLPEKIFPIIYSNIVRIIVDFAPGKISQIVLNLQNRCKDQLGLYSEGFRYSIYEICKILVKNQLLEQLSEIIEIWKEYTLNGVQNRWERTPELLKIMEIYGLAGNIEMAEEVFSEMLKTSMGPSWYKEDQLALINRTLTLKNEGPSFKENLKNFAALLDFASGEMTFKRFVRNSKESFVSRLVENDQLEVALEYFKFECLPPQHQVIKNAEYDTIDTPMLGHGYAAGANNITPENAIYKIIESAEIQSPYLCWALAEIFIINPDVEDYIEYYAAIHDQVLSELDQIDDNKIHILLKSVVEIASHPKMKNTRVNYLTGIFSFLNDSYKIELQKQLKEASIEWKIEDKKNKDEELDSLSIPEEKKIDFFTPFIENYSKFHKIQSKRKMLIDQGIEAFKNSKLPVWSPNYSSSSVKSRGLLMSLFNSDKETISELRYFIETFDDLPWMVTSQLIWFLENKLSSVQIENIYDVISEHFKELIRPTSEIVEKYDWINDNDASIRSNDEKIGNFLIWLLNHPVDRISERTYHSILRLGNTDPEFIIPLLIQSCIKNEIQWSTERSSFILLTLAEKQPNTIEKAIVKFSYSVITAIDHFTIRHNFYKIALLLKDSGSPDLYDQFILSYPISVAASNEVDLNLEYLEFIEYELSMLNEMGILNRSFCESLVAEIESAVKPLSIAEFQKADYYTKRSFFESVNGIERFEYVLKYALNKAVNQRVSIENAEDVYEIVNI
ncbi:serine protease [Flavobacterium sp. WG21]|uniref:serine protease n=1 Tax=Flavobacterium sp. WG21 TaxID=1229487 RepID=UPI00034BE543|nr:serine protease [Flavobacterium sp. WG21]